MKTYKVYFSYGFGGHRYVMQKDFIFTGKVIKMTGGEDRTLLEAKVFCNSGWPLYKDSIRIDEVDLRVITAEVTETI